jgi:DNA-binding response OmpR family regulator
MPGMDGLATLLSLRAMESMSSTPVIFMTAKAQVQEIAQYQAVGALDIIPKPFDPMTLATTISTIWQRHQRA